ncbi:MAG TPA: hypothetical protein VL484_07460 [Vicinamibacterales bacterium]|nr:hypothetical protein [Vicinamibacterales bacterium]
MLATSTAFVAIGLTLATPATPQAHLRLVLAGGSTGIVSVILDEAARVWARYGISIQSATEPPADGAIVRVVIHDTAGSIASDAAADPHALGSVVFHDGVPDPQITLYEGRAWDLIGRAEGSAIDHWPLTYRRLVLGRVLGRALAHELGHYLLQTPTHSTAGLMRASQQIADLMATDDRRVFLSSENLAALPAAIDRLRYEGRSGLCESGIKPRSLGISEDGLPNCQPEEHAMNNAVVGLCLAGVMTAALGAQDKMMPNATTDHTTAYSGCVERSSDGRFTLSHPMAAKTQMTHAKHDAMSHDAMGSHMAGDAMKKETMAKEAMAKDTMAPLPLALTPSGAVELEKYVGQKVTVTGTPADGMARTLSVVSVKSIAASCQ